MYFPHHIRLSLQIFLVILHIDFHAVGALLRGVYRYGTREIYYIFEKAYIYALFLATRNFEHSKQSPKDRVTIDATGMYIPIRLISSTAWNEFGVSAHSSVESKLLVLAIKASSKATSCGTSNDKTPAFLFAQTNLIMPCRSQWLRKRVTRSATHWQHKSNPA